MFMITAGPCLIKSPCGTKNMANITGTVCISLTVIHWSHDSWLYPSISVCNKYHCASKRSKEKPKDNARDTMVKNLVTGGMFCT